MAKKSNFSIKGHIVDPVNEKIFDGVLSVCDGIIVSVEPCDDVPEDAPYIMPGFIDSHMHIESTLLLPENFAKIAVTHGTVGVVTDPHEIANVLGIEGIDYMIDNAKNVKFNFMFGIPSCVPSTCFETAGAMLTSEDIKALLPRDEFYGLAEMMNYPGVLFEDPEVMEKIRATREAGKVIDGHAPGVSGEQARAYIAAGIDTDHEEFDIDNARERLELGMSIQIREGSAARNFDALWPLLLEDRFKGSLMLCTDDIYPDELLDGHIDALVARAVGLGVPLWNVLTAACVTPVRHYFASAVSSCDDSKAGDCAPASRQIRQIGLLQPGDSADFILVRDLQSFHVLATFIRGDQVFSADSGSSLASNTSTALRDSSSLLRGESTSNPTAVSTQSCCVNNCDTEVSEISIKAELPNKFNASVISEKDIAVPVFEGEMKVICASEGALYTTVVKVTPKIADGVVVSDTERDILKLVVYNRYAPAKPAVAFIHGFGLQTGAMASTIAHDSHNIIALGVDDADIVAAVNTLVASHGGLCIIGPDQEPTSLPLPVAGLMSPLDGETVGAAHRALKAKATAQGCAFAAPFMTLAFMALPVIPELKLTDLGLFDGLAFSFTSLFD